MKKQLILASHGSLAEGMLTAIEMILGNVHNVAAFGLGRYETPEAIDDKLSELIVDFDEGVPLIIITDIKGGSVYNKLIQRCSEPNVYVLSGMNLSLCIGVQLNVNNVETLEKDLQVSIENSQQGIELFTKSIIESKKNQEEEELW